MFSFESSRSKAYASNIRWRMIHQRYSRGLAYAQIATNLNVDPSTVCRIVQLFEQTGTVESIQGYHEKTTKRLSNTDELVLMEAITKQPSIYLHELQHILFQTGTTICLAAIHNFLKFQGFSHKKLSRRALQRSDRFLKYLYMSPTCWYLWTKQGLTDVQHFASMATLSRERPATADTLLVRGRRYSVIAAMAFDGIVDVHITGGSVDGDRFCEFIEKYLLPQLLPFNSVNGRSVVIMDNASIHHTERTTAPIEEIGAIPIFLPPYSPDIMPIEECFSKVKKLPASE